jgi:nitrogenase molybdenum-iron protein alpha/beta subunit
MKDKDIAELLDEPACSHNKKSKSGCAFDGAQIALLPIADVAHIVHGSIACAGSSWDIGKREPDPLPKHAEREGIKVHDVNLIGE